MTTRKELLASIYKRYRFASRKEKVVILNEFCAATDYNRKYAIRLLANPLHLAPPARKGKRQTYTNEDVYYLKKIWDILDYPCGQRLKPIVPEMIRVLEQWKELVIPDKVKKHLAMMSDRTMDRKLAHFKQEAARKIHGTTKPGSLLKKTNPHCSFSLG